MRRLEVGDARRLRGPVPPEVRAGEAEGLRDRVELVPEASPGEAEADDVGVVHELKVLPEDLLECAPPVHECLLPGHDLERPELVDPAVRYRPPLGVDVLGEVHRHAGGCVVQDVVPGLLEEPEHRVGDEDRAEQVALGVYGGDDPPRGDIEGLSRPDAQEPSGEGGEGHRPALLQEGNHGVGAEGEAADRDGGHAEGRGEQPPAYGLPYAPARGRVGIVVLGEGLELLLYVDLRRIRGAACVLRRHPSPPCPSCPWS